MQNFQVMPDLTNSLEDFTGNESATVAIEWLINVDNMRVLNRRPDHIALVTAHLHLKSGAAQRNCSMEKDVGANTSEE